MGGGSRMAGRRGRESVGKGKWKKPMTTEGSDELFCSSAHSIPTPPGKLGISNLKIRLLCRRSILDKAWHRKFSEASRSLLNFHSLKECLVYVIIFFPALQPDIKLLRERGVEHFASQ